MKKLNLVQPRLNYYFPVNILLHYAWFCLFSKYKLDKNDASEITSTFKPFFFFNSGHAALQFFLSQFKKGTRVGVQPLTCNTVFESIKKAECEVIFIDINTDLLIDMDALKSKLNQIDILIVTHTFGNSADIKAIKSLKKELIIIEDCCHAFLSKFDGKYVGADGDASFFSHGIAKFPSVFNGGYLSVNNLQFIENCKKSYLTIPKPSIIETLAAIFNNIILVFLHNILVYSFLTKLFKQKTKHKQYQFPNFDNIRKGYPFAKFILYSELKNIEKYRNTQCKNALKIENELKTHRLFSFPVISNQANNFMLPAFIENPDKFIAFAQSRGIEIGKHFTQMRKIIPYFGYKDGDCQNYEILIRKLITFPTHYKYPADKVQKICSIISEYKI